MTSEEQQQAVEDLEVRVERIRALYEQYFMGIEKIEPLVQRKDIDRKLWVLRREQIRNTGLRFKLQQVVSRYNTFGMYWMRILREIENGTYKRDVARAAKRFGSEALTIAAKRRLGKRGLAAIEEGAASKRAPASIAPPREEDDSTSPFRRSDVPPSSAGLDRTTPDAGPPAPHSDPPPRAPSKPKQAPIHLDLDLDDDDDDLFAGLDMGPSKSTPPRAPSGAVPRPSSSVVPRVPSAPTPTAPLRSSPATPLPPAQRSAPPDSHPSAPHPPAAVRSGLAASAPFRGSSLASSGNPFAARPAAPAPPPKPSAPPAPPPRPTRDPNDLPDTRLRELYSKYVDAKRQCNESTATITTDSLAKSLRESANKLRQKHAGKNVDFDVVIKDGKAVLKPILKLKP